MDSQNQNQNQPNQAAVTTSINPTITEGASSETSNRTRQQISRVNVGFLALGIVILLAIGLLVFVSIRSQADDPTFDTIELSPQELSKLSANTNEIQPGDDTLTIGPNAEFKNDVVVRKSLEIVGDLTVGGDINSSQSGESDAVNPGSINGNLAINGGATVAGALSIGGDLNVGGVISATSLNVANLASSGDFGLNRHLVSGGGAVSASGGSGLGSGGTASISGNDVAGTITVNTGSGTAAGTLMSVDFRQDYKSTPKVLVTPVGAGGSSLNYYVTRSATGFVLAVSSSAPAGSNFQFDYFVIE